MKKTVLRITAVLAAVLLLAILIPACLIAGSMDGRGEPTGEVLIVLGTTVNGTEPSPMLRQRLDAALEYLNTYPDASASSPAARATKTIFPRPSACSIT